MARNPDTSEIDTAPIIARLRDLAEQADTFETELADLVPEEPGTVASRKDKAVFRLLDRLADRLGGQPQKLLDVIDAIENLEAEDDAAEDDAAEDDA